tara:strand:- start:2999 stop:3115 length:117 start_codon:yes stop_codon:yes gene_type:complete
MAMLAYVDLFAQNNSKPFYGQHRIGKAGIFLAFPNLNP